MYVVGIGSVRFNLVRIKNRTDPDTDCNPAKMLLKKRRLSTLAIECRKPQVSILYLWKVMPKTATRTDFLMNYTIAQSEMRSQRILISSAFDSECSQGMKFRKWLWLWKFFENFVTVWRSSSKKSNISDHQGLFLRSRCICFWQSLWWSHSNF